MPTIVRSLNNPPYDYDPLNHIQHATPRFASYFFMFLLYISKICNEIWVLMQKCRTPVKEPSLSQHSISSQNLGLQYSLLRFTKAEQSYLQ